MKLSEAKTTAKYFEELETTIQTTETESIIELIDSRNEIGSDKWNEEAARLFQAMSDNAAQIAKEQIEFLYPKMADAA